MTVDDPQSSAPAPGTATGGAGGSGGSAGSGGSGVHATPIGREQHTPHHEVDHTAQPTADPLAIRLEQLILGAERRYTLPGGP